MRVGLSFVHVYLGKYISALFVTKIWNSPWANFAVRGNAGLRRNFDFFCRLKQGN